MERERKKLAMTASSELENRSSAWIWSDQNKWAAIFRDDNNSSNINEKLQHDSKQKANCACWSSRAVTLRLPSFATPASHKDIDKLNTSDSGVFFEGAQQVVGFLSRANNSTFVATLLQLFVWTETRHLQLQPQLQLQLQIPSSFVGRGARA